MYGSNFDFFMHFGKMHILNNAWWHYFFIETYHDGYQKKRLNLRNADSHFSLLLHLFFFCKLRKCIKHTFKNFLLYIAY